IREKVYGPDDPRMCLTLAKLALVAAKRGRKDEAIAFAARAIAIGEHGYGPESPNLGQLHQTLAEVLMDFDEPARALPHLQRTLALRRPGVASSHPDQVPLFELAQAHHALGHDRKLVAALAEAGAMRYAAWGESNRATEIRRWIPER